MIRFCPNDGTLLMSKTEEEKEASRMLHHTGG